MTFECPTGYTCSNTMSSRVGSNDTSGRGAGSAAFRGEKVDHITATRVNIGQNQEFTDVKTVVYIKKSGTYQPAAVTTDGGKNYIFSDTEFPTMDGVASVDVSNGLNDKDSKLGIRKNVNQQTQETYKKEGYSDQQIRSIVASTTNQATIDPDTPKTPASEFKDSGDDKEGTRRNFGTFRYPENLGETTQDYIKIDMMKYEAAGLDITKDRAGLGGEGNNGQERKSVGSVILPIPGGIKDSNKATWGGDNLNALEMAAASLALETIKEGKKGAAGELSSIAQNIKTDNQGLKEATASAFTAAAIGKDFKSLMGRTTGQILNPNMELLFQSPSLRPFSFTFLLAPRTKSEAQQVIQIIRFFKQGMAPIRSEAHLFLKAPNTFQLQYKHRGENHPYLNKFKECALQNCEINYTPQNNYSTFEDGVMNAYEMTLSFQELTPIYNDDYEDTTASSLTDGVEWDLVGDYSGLGGRPGDESGPEIGY